MLGVVCRNAARTASPVNVVDVVIKMAAGAAKSPLFARPSPLAARRSPLARARGVRLSALFRRTFRRFRNSRDERVGTRSFFFSPMAFSIGIGTTV